MRTLLLVLSDVAEENLKRQAHHEGVGRGEKALRELAERILAEELDRLISYERELYPELFVTAAAAR